MKRAPLAPEWARFSQGPCWQYSDMNWPSTALDSRAGILTVTSDTMTSYGSGSVIVMKPTYRDA